MNKPAPKEPSMDEILSSIRQIIADDDAATVPKRPPVLPPSPALTPRPFAASPAPAPLAAPAMPAFTPEPEPLALSAEQILRDDADETPSRSLSFDEILGTGAAKTNGSTPFDGEPELVDPEDISFEGEEDDDDEVMPAPVVAAKPQPIMPPLVFERPAARPAPAPVTPRPPMRPAMSVAQAAPMPDPTLSAEMAEELLEPTTQSAVKSTFARLNGLASVGSGVTIEEMMREMLRPMLKEWLDENLPAVVERMVEKEIARVSRGGH